MKTITLTDGSTALVDDADYGILSQFTWYNRKGYAKTKWQGIEILMHRLLLGAKAGTIVDHADRNRLNNQRSNLRYATSSQNRQNISRPSHNTSGYKGVGWHKKDKKWQAYICHNGKQKHLGLFDDIEDAAAAYNKAALDTFGEFASLNG